jgi:hypothetical protein
MTAVFYAVELEKFSTAICDVIAMELAFLTLPFMGYFFANPASITPRNGDILWVHDGKFIL